MATYSAQMNEFNMNSTQYNYQIDSNIHILMDSLSLSIPSYIYIYIKPKFRQNN